MLARGILGSGRTGGVSFWPFLNSFGWWWLISSIFLTRISCHETTHANGYWRAWPGWAASVSGLPLTEPAFRDAQEHGCAGVRLNAVGKHWSHSLGAPCPLRIWMACVCLEESGFLIPTLWGMVFTDEARKFRSIYVPNFSKDYYFGETQKHVSGLFIYFFFLRQRNWIWNGQWISQGLE